MKYFVVNYSGPFGFIKPWTAVRDASGGMTYSQQFLTPSIIEGIRQKLEVNAILRHKLTYSGIDVQQETVQAKAWKKIKKMYQMEKSILKRGVMISPILYLAFENSYDALKAVEQHICLCRNEDILFPSPEVKEMSEDEFNKLNGFELRFGKGNGAFMVGYNRFSDNEEMFGRLEITGTPIRKD